MKLKVYVVLFMILSITQLNAQIPNRGCGTVVPDPQYDALFQQKVLDYLNQTTATSRVQSTFQIPVIIHVIHGGQAVGTFPNLAQGQLNSQIQVLNEDYGALGFNSSTYPSTAFLNYAMNTQVLPASKDGFGNIKISNTGISFCLALKDSLGNMLPEPGIQRLNWTSISGAADPASYSSAGTFQTAMNSIIKPATIWSPNKYLNIWVSDVNASAGLLGFTAFPPLSGLTGIVGPSTATTDGLWCWAKAFGSQTYYSSGIYSVPYNLGRTSTHELSHYFGIRHIWGDALCATDYCNDTPSQQGATYGIANYPYLPNNCTSTVPPTGAEGIMFMNFSDYTDDASMYMFTEDQKVRMQTAMVNCPYRNQLGTHGLCNAVVTPTANFSLSSTIISQGQSVSITDLSLPTGSITAWNYISTASTSTVSILQNPTFTFNTVGVHTISLTVTSAGLNSTIAKTLNVTSCPTPTLSSTSVSVSCNGACSGTATITVSGASGAPYTYSWTPASATSSVVTNLCAGVYTCVVTNSCGVSAAKPVIISQPPPTTISIVASSPSVCAGVATILSSTVSGGTPGYTYNWNTGSTINNITVTPTISPMTAYTLSVSDSHGCLSSKVFSVVVHPIPNITANHLPILPICAGKTATINLTGAASFTTNPGNITASTFTVNPTSTTPYNIIGVSSQGCFGSASDTIKVYSLPSILSNVNSNTICVGATLTFSNSGGATYTLSPSAITGSVINTFPTAAGVTVYTISGTNPLGCTNTKTVSITVYSTPNINITPSNTTICAGQSLVLTALGANTYTWNTGSIGSTLSVSPSTSLTYSVMGKNSAGCDNIATATINVAPSPIVSINSPSTSVCFGYTMTISASGASNYHWFNGANTNTINVQPFSNTTYSVIGNNGGACADTAFLSIVSLPAPTVLASVNNSLACIGQTVNLTASGNAVYYLWKPGNLNGANQVVQINSPTTFTAYGQGSNGCAFLSTVFVDIQSASVIIPVSTPSAVCIGDTAFLSVIGGTVPLWSGNIIPNTSIATPTTNTSFTVSATDINGCASDVLFNIGINEDCNVNVYNGFTPNGDGINDFWVIDNIDKYPNNKVYIYNRWGNRIFETKKYNNTSNNWDGKLNGKPITSGTYFYVIETDNDKLFKKGWIEITN